MHTMMTNWWTTLLGALLGVLTYASQVGAKLPETKQEWWGFGVGAGLAALGFASKDATTGSRPDGTTTPASRWPK